MQVSKDRGRWAYLRLALAGALMIVPVGLAGLAGTALGATLDSALARNVSIALLGSALPEELARFGVLYYFLARRQAGAAGPSDGLICGILVSLGFSLAENLLYGLSLGWHMALAKLAIATPIHLALGIAMGGLIVLAAGGGWGRLLLLALAPPALLHGIYDLSLLSAMGQADPARSLAVRLAPPVVCYLAVIGFAVWSGWRVRRLSRDGGGGRKSA